MSGTQNKIRGDTTANLLADGALAQKEIAMDTTRNALVLGDGATAGGRPYPGIDGSKNLVLEAGETFTADATLNAATDTTNTLAHYQEGAWTPFLYGATTAGSPTYTLQVGSYERVGRRVTCQFYLALSALGGMAGTINIGGLPFTIANASGDGGSGGFGQFDLVTLDSGYSWAGLIGIPNSTDLQIMEMGSNKASQGIAVANWSASAILRGSFSYHV